MLSRTTTTHKCEAVTDHYHEHVILSRTTTPQICEAVTEHYHEHVMLSRTTTTQRREAVTDYYHELAWSVTDHYRDGSGMMERKGRNTRHSLG